MADHPILFGAPMVRAILAGDKTQTRRIVRRNESGRVSTHGRQRHMDDPRVVELCPYGQSGDLLWVREACRAEELVSGLDGVRYLADDAFVPIVDTSDASVAWTKLNTYRGKRGAAVPPIHMPRWASRITLAITDIRIERVQDTMEDDAVAEGMNPAQGLLGDDDLSVWCVMDNLGCPAPVARFVLLWDSINGKRPGVTDWNANPWVWVVEFRKHTLSVDCPVSKTQP